MNCNYSAVRLSLGVNYSTFILCDLFHTSHVLYKYSFMNYTKSSLPVFLRGIKSKHLISSFFFPLTSMASQHIIPNDTTQMLPSLSSLSLMLSNSPQQTISHGNFRQKPHWLVSVYLSSWMVHILPHHSQLQKILLRYQTQHIKHGCVKIACCLVLSSGL